MWLLAATRVTARIVIPARDASFLDDAPAIAINVPRDDERISATG